MSKKFHYPCIVLNKTFYPVEKLEKVLRLVKFVNGWSLGMDSLRSCASLKRFALYKLTETVNTLCEKFTLFQPQCNDSMLYEYHKSADMANVFF